MEKSLYIHIPFCRSKCPYCDFHSIVPQSQLANDYIKALVSKISFLNSDFSSVYIGGGTPSALSLANLKKLITVLRPITKEVGEFTIEVNPESSNEKKFELFLKNNVSRISIGVQSFNGKKLKKLGRVHSAEDSKRVVKLAKSIGFEDIGIDLIFGVNGESLADWKKELRIAVALGLKHISTYCLTYEEGTPLFMQIKKKFIIPLDDKITSNMYKESIKYLTKFGYRHYEISNFAKPGFESKHNMNYWYGYPYLGLGPSAVSYLDGRRQKNTSSVTDYIDKLNRGITTVVFSETLSKKRKAKELAALRIRTNEGINFDWFKKNTGFDFLRLEERSLGQLLDNRLLRYKLQKGKITGICLTNKGFLFCDTVSSSFL